jgi:hypothetical protein
MKCPIDVLQREGDHTYIAGRCHKIAVAGPARHDVKVQMPGHSGAGGSSQIHPDIEPAWIKLGTQCFDRPLGQSHHFVQRRFRQLFKVADMAVRHNHHVSGSIGVTIEDDETIFGAMENQIGAVLLLRQHQTEDTPLGFGTANKLTAPGSENVLGHKEPSIRKR